MRFAPSGGSASETTFTPSDTITSTTVQGAIIEALTDARDYADAVAAGLDPKSGVDVATNAALPANTRTGNVLTASANGVAPTIDTNYTPVVGRRILVKDEATQANNGIYTWTSVGSVGTPWVLTRASDADTSAKVTSGLYTGQTFGAHARQGWVLTTVDPIVLNTSALIFGPFALLSIDGASVINTPAGNIAATNAQAAINELDTEKAALAGATFTGRVVETPNVLTSTGASIALNLALGNNFSHTLTENTTLAAPSNAVAGQEIKIVLTQHASAPKTLAYNSFWKFPLGIIPSLTATNSAVDVLVAYVESASRATCRILPDVK